MGKKGTVFTFLLTPCYRGVALRDGVFDVTQLAAIAGQVYFRRFALISLQKVFLWLRSHC
jgi:hypothetical protein